MNKGWLTRKNQIILSYSEVALAIIGGVLPLLFIPQLPHITNNIAVIIMLFMIALFIRGNKFIRLCVVVVISFSWGCWHGEDIRRKIESLSGTSHLLQMTIVSIPVNTSEKKFTVSIDKIEGKRVFPPLYATWKWKGNPSISVCAGQRWLINGKLNPLHSSLNEGGFNQQRYLLSQRIIGSLKSQQLELVNPQCSLRQKVINHFSDKLHLLANAGIIYALMFGERGLLTEGHSQLLQNTGLTHLIAISGLHIGIAYLIGYRFIWLAQYFFPAKWINENIPMISGVLFAFLYAWISDFAIPATRAFLALLLWAYIRQQSFYCFPWQWALWSVAFILLIDPLAILSDSFWLSSFAVLAILYWIKIFPLSDNIRYRPFIGKIAPLLHLQVGLLILLMPIQVLLFGGINLMSLFANLWFVPIVTWIVVPIIFSLFLLPINNWQELAFQLIDEILVFSLRPLIFLEGYWLDINSISWYVIFLFWGLLFAILFHWHKNYIGLLSCIVALLFTNKTVSKHESHDWCLTLLDVGHGLAVVIRQGEFAILYDTGNRWQGGSNGKRQIIPYIKYHQITPVGIILSHNHLDHTGGVDDLTQQYPWVNIRSSFGENQHLPCYQGQSWKWGKLKFDVLWPEKLSIESHNNDSCVIQLDDGYQRILLTGDLEKEGEKALVAQYQHQLASDILLAPHHGSNTSSTALLLRTVKPRIALVSSARYSPWKIPSDKVYFRYTNDNIKWLNTAEVGQITICFKKEKMEILRYRQEIHPRWYHLWFGDRPFP
ncbi:DNA internalization-related competence protein ComEC/Rec2 [Providencia rustigianii]|uniref:DNA internalization-related competence protein ComEC/Rec2 n=1 Tax=Providencia rustigianii TaxID=158850 RepID=UPI0022407EA2|nr:DNA internalization-related competence protein ComEC/Rec2 [Providencia rustigianii]